MDLTATATDLDAEKKGVWVRYPRTNLEFRIGRVTQPEYIQEARRLTLSLRRNRSVDDIPDSDIMEAVIEPVCKYVLLDWRDITGEEVTIDGEPFPYSIQNARKMLSDPRFRDLYQWVMRVANDGESYRAATIEEDSGNLQTESGTD